MGYRTPNIDRLAKEGVMFTDYYAEQSCTAGRSSFITGQCTLRTGLSKVGIPAAPVGLQARDITIAEALKPLGYATGQFGKNHLGDRNEYLPTVHGFDEFFGNLYHLNAEEEPEDFNYPRDPQFRERLGLRGVLKCKASDRDDPTEQPRWSRVGKQTIEDTGPLTRKRMETIDDETSDAAVDYIKRQVTAGAPFFCWYNATRMHLRTHVRKEHRSAPGLTALTEYVDGMVEHDGHIGKLLKALDDLGIAGNTPVIYTADNGPHMNTWPDGAMTPFRSEKNTNWEGAFRVPCFVRWPGKIKPGQVSNEIVSGLDWFPTLLAAAGAPDVKQVVGSSGVVRFDMQPDGRPVLVKIPKVEFVDDGPGKPVGINRFIGRQPVFAFGNSDGDLQMLQWTAAGNGGRSGARFMGLVHHTDAEREYAYDRQSKGGRLNKALDEAVAKGWTVVDMKKDWRVIFPFRE